MEKPKKINKCSFCGLSQVEAYKLIAGPEVFICDECVNTAYHLIFSREKADPVKILKEKLTISGIGPKAKRFSELSTIKGVIEVTGTLRTSSGAINIDVEGTAEEIEAIKNDIRRTVTSWDPPPSPAPTAPKRREPSKKQKLKPLSWFRRR